MCGAIKPIKPMVPTKETASAANRLMRNKELRRRRWTLIPKLSARSSPRRKAVSFYESRIAKGNKRAKAKNIRPTLGQLALDKLPRVQKTKP